MRYHVLWVNTVMRLPSLNAVDLKKIYTKFFAKNSTVSSTAVSKINLQVIKPFMIPIFSQFFRKINAILLSRQLNTVLRQQNFHHSILVTTVPIVADIVDNILAEKIVYYCVDEFAEWEGHHREQMQTMEALLLAKSDVVITTSETLYQSKKDQAKKIHTLSHGVDVAHFQDTSRKKSLGISHPILGYYGLFDERNDLELLQYILRQKPSWHIVIIGNIACDISMLTAYPNLTVWGSLSYRELPSYVHDFDVCILPYRRTMLTEFINPLKFKEYLATGLPVVTTALPSLQEYRDVIGWAETYARFVEYMEYFLEHEEPSAREKRLLTTRHLLEGQSWEEKTEQFLEYINS